MNTGWFIYESVMHTNNETYVCESMNCTNYNVLLITFNYLEYISYFVYCTMVTVSATLLALERYTCNRFT